MLLVMMSHAMLETARDALFLEQLPARRLPWAYLAIAVLAVLELRAINKLLEWVTDRRRLLSVSMAAASAITFAFWAWLQNGTPIGVMSFYVWTGLLVTVVLVQLWLLIGDSVTVTQAKRVFAPIAAGGVTGAVIGSFLADTLLRIVPTSTLILVSATFLLLGALQPLALPASRESPDQPNNQDSIGDQRDGLRALFSSPYLRQLFSLVLIGTIALTGVDFVFKSIVAQEIYIENLGSFFARFYLVINIISLGIQLLVSSRILQAIGVHRAISLLPVLLLATVLGVAFMPILATALLMKGVDGSLRHSLYRTGQEVLYLPLTNRVRSRSKTLIDAFGNRGGQAIASILILLSLSIGASIVQICMFVFVLCLLWIVTIVAMQPRYLELFRARLKIGAVETRVGQSDLDLHSLEVLLNSLNSEDDDEVGAAIDLFVAHGKTSLLPVLLLYHPSNEVKLRSLDAFTSEGDARFVPVAKRLLRSDDEKVRAAVLRALASIGPNTALFRKHLQGDTPAVQATALVGLLATSPNDVHLREQLNNWINIGSIDTQTQLARAIGEQVKGDFTDALVRLCNVDNNNLRSAVADAMASRPNESFMPHFLFMLGVSELRSSARKGFLALGQQAFDFLQDTLDDPEVLRKIRRHVPRTISRFEPHGAAEFLLARMLIEDDGAVRYKSLRGLGRLVANNPKLKLDKKKLNTLIDNALQRALQMMTWRNFSQIRGDTDTPGGSLLDATLLEKQKNALERCFRLLGLRHRREDFSLIWRGLGSEDKKIQSASRELLDGALSGNLREAVLAMVDDDAAQNKIRRASRALGYKNESTTYEAALVSMLHDRSEAVRCIVAYHIAELGIYDLAGELERVRLQNQGSVRDAIDRALRVLSTPPPSPGGVPSVA